MSDLREHKARIRNERLALRDAIEPEARLEKSLAITEFGEALSIEPGMVVSGFMPIRSEADIRPLMDSLRKRGDRICVPVVIDKEFGKVTFHYSISPDGSTLMLDPVLPACAEQGCFDAQWAVAVAYPGLPWERIG